MTEQSFSDRVYAGFEDWWSSHAVEHVLELPDSVDLDRLKALLLNCYKNGVGLGIEICFPVVEYAEVVREGVVGDERLLPEVGGGGSGEADPPSAVRVVQTLPELPNPQDEGGRSRPPINPGDWRVPGS